MTTNLLAEGFIHQLQQLVNELGPAGLTNRNVCPFYQQDDPDNPTGELHLGTCDTLHHPLYGALYGADGTSPNRLSMLAVCPNSTLTSYWCEHPNCGRWHCAFPGGALQTPQAIILRGNYTNVTQIVCRGPVHLIQLCHSCGAAGSQDPWRLDRVDGGTFGATDGMWTPVRVYSECTGDWYCQMCWENRGGCQCDDCGNDSHDDCDDDYDDGCNCDACSSSRTDSGAYLCDPDRNTGESRNICGACGHRNNHLDLFTEQFVCACRIRAIVERDSVDWPRFVLAGPVRGAQHVTHKTVERIRGS